MTVEVRVLGAVALVRDGEAASSPEKQRRLLAALTAAAGQAVSNDRLVDALWPESPPASANELLQVYVSQLRKALGAAAAVVRRGRGYALEAVDDPVVDADRFDRLIRGGDAAFSHGSPARAVSLFSQALALWHGPAYDPRAPSRVPATRGAGLRHRADRRLRRGLRIRSRR